MAVLFKIAKFLLGVVAVCCLFLFLMITGIISAPLLTSKHYETNESPSYIFNVVLETFDSSLNRPRFECVRWDDFQKIQPQVGSESVYPGKETYTFRGSNCLYEEEYSVYLSVPEGGCDNISSRFIVQNLDAHTQLVRLRWSQEAFKVRNSYRVVENAVVPLHSSKFMSAGIAITMFFIILITLPTIIIGFGICHKKYGKFISIGMAFILLGLGALNMAIFDRRMSLDPLTDNPELFMNRNLIFLFASGILLVGGAIFFWLHKKKRLLISENATNKAM